MAVRADGTLEAGRRVLQATTFAGGRKAVPLSLFLAAAACAPGGPPTRGLVVALPAEPASLDPVTAGRAVDDLVVSAVHLPLLDARFDGGLAFGPAIAVDWTVADEGRAVELDLRPGLRWSDGVPFSPDDIVFTVDLMRDPAVASPRGAALADLAPGPQPEVVDPTRVVFRFAGPGTPESRLEAVSTVVPVPRHVLAGADRSRLREHPWTRDPAVHLGRWRLAEWVRGDHLVLEPEPAWSGPPDERPALDRVVLRVLPEAATRLVELESGGVDVVTGVDPASADRLARQHPELELARRGLRTVEFIAWNLHDPERPEAPHPLFGAAAVRRALAMALDVDAAMTDLLGVPATGEVLGRRAAGTISPERADAPRDLAPPPHDPEAARRALAAAGWTDSDGDGVRDRDGRPFRFTLLVNRGNERRARAAVRFQADLARVGVRAEIRTLDFGAFVARQRQGDFDAAIDGLAAGLGVDLDPVWHSDRPFNFGGYASAEVDRLVEEARATADPEAAARLRRAAMARVLADQPVAFLWWVDELVAVNRRVAVHPIDLVSPLRDLHRWRLAGGGP